MNRLYKLIPVLLLCFSFSCKKDHVSPIDTLPAATQEGLQTFGCLINGEAHLPKEDVTASYGNVISQTESYLSFQLYTHDKSATPVPSVGIFAKNVKLEAGKTYVLRAGNEAGTVTADYMVGSDEMFAIVPPLTGELTITHHNEMSKTLSGTFWFDAVNAAGKKVEVRAGRFDVNYTTRSWKSRW